MHLLCVYTEIFIPESTAQNEILSYEAKGLLLQLLTSSKYKQFYSMQKKDFVSKGTGRQKVTRIFNELQQAGFVCFLKNPFSNVQICVVSDTPKTKEEFESFVK